MMPSHASRHGWRRRPERLVWISTFDTIYVAFNEVNSTASGFWHRFPAGSGDLVDVVF